MRAGRATAALAGAAVLALAVAGCRLGPQAEGSGASLTVSRDYGAEVVTRASEKDLPGGETAMRLLQRNADVDTSYGGRFVNAIGKLRSSTTGGRQDWFYYVNGIEADRSAAEKRLHDGDRVWWDYHDWGAAMRVPAVVGSFPEPFEHGQDGKRYPVRVDCAADADKACRDVLDRLDRAGVTASSTAIGAPAGKEVLRLMVGEWDQVRRDAAALQIEEGPARSGVFARIGPGSAGPELLLLDEGGRIVQRIARGGGLVAATRFEEQQPTWVVTGTDTRGLDAATKLVSEPLLRDRFAVATSGGGPVALPVREGGR
jgi:hypothetical protein